MARAENRLYGRWVDSPPADRRPHGASVGGAANEVRRRIARSGRADQLRYGDRDGAERSKAEERVDEPKPARPSGHDDGRESLRQAVLPAAAGEANDGRRNKTRRFAEQTNHDNEMDFSAKAKNIRNN